MKKEEFSIKEIKLEFEGIIERIMKEYDCTKLEAMSILVRECY